MGLPFATTFQFDAPRPENGSPKLAGVIQFLQDELSSASAAAASDIEMESGAASGYGYAIITTERPHPQLAGQMMQLEVRLCSQADGPIHANFRSRFISGDGADPPDILAGPPRLLLSVAEHFECYASGCRLLENTPAVDTESVSEFVSGLVFDVNRELPLLVCSRRPDGIPQVDPERLQRALLGLAQVVQLDNAAHPLFRELTGLACYNGAARWLWPGSSGGYGGRPANSYCSPERLTESNALYNLQQTALGRAMTTAFDAQYSLCRTEVILERNRQLEAERKSVPSPPPDTELQAEALKERRRASLNSQRLSQERAKVARLDQQLTEAYDRIAELEEWSATASADETPDSAGELRRTVRELREQLSKRDSAITKLNDAAQKYRQQERTGTARNGLTLPLGSSHPGWLTICLHALNIYRDPMRRFVIDRLRNEHGDYLEHCVKSCVDYSNRKGYNPDDPESSIDVGDFQDLVQINRQCFAEDRLRPSLLGDIRRFRNNVTHPPVGGLDATHMADGLRNIKDALEIIGADEAANEVSGLTALVR